MDDLLQEFIAETRETLDALSGEIVAWESDPSDRTRLDSIFRFVHTVKGSCGFLDLPRLARLSNAAEDVLSTVRDGERTADTALVDAVLAIIDRIGEIVEAIDAGASLDDSSEDLLIAALDENAAAIAATVATAPTIQRAPSRSVRLSVDLLDRMMGGMSDMVLARNDLARRLRDNNGDPAVMIALARLSTTVADMRDTVTRTRMQRIDALFSALPRLVRDTAASVGKSVTLVIDGGDVELDREMIEMLRDPLAHMVRNAIDHGIEPPALRRASGKPQTGRLTVAARQSGNRIVVEIFDDGGGIDTDRLVAKAQAHDPRRTAELAVMDAAARLDLIFEPGLSTRDQVTAVSGRGVGMDVVRANVEQIGGRIALNNRPGQGLEVTLEVPLTLAILPAVVVVAGGQDFAIPRRAIEEIVATRGEAIRIDALGAARIATIRGQRMPLVSLGAILGLGDPGNDPDAAPAMLVILEVPGGHYALAVDAVLDTEELVVRPAAPAVMAAGIYAGQTLPDSGRPLLMIDCAGVASAAGVAFDRARATEPDIAAIADPGIAALLFQDLDGHRRAIALAAIDRIDQIGATAIARTGGRLRMVTDNTTVALVATGEVPATGDIGVLRLHDGAREIGYVIAAAIDIVTLTAPIVAAEGGGAISGVTVLDGQPVEMLDPLWLLDRSVPPLVAAKPVCLVQGGDAGWMTIFLGPALTAAGYRVVTDLAPGEAADVVLAMEGESVAGPQPGSVVTLSRDRDGEIYCYDRAALVAAVSARISGGRT